MRVDIIGQDKSERHSRSILALDGTAAPVEGDITEADSGAAAMPVPNVLVLQLARAGAPASTRVYIAAPDGRTMIETSSHLDEDSKPMVKKNYFTRVR